MTAWEARAADWLAWARTPGHDAYWTYRDFFFELLPPPGRATLEVGAGEGRVARDLADRGHRVTAVEPSPTLAAAAAEDERLRVVEAHAEALPFADGAFELAVAYNSLMDVDDMPRSVAEAARVLEPGGRLCACVTHPLLDAGVWEDGTLVVEGSYFGRRRFEATIERDGLSFSFTGWAYALEDYARALEDAGLYVEAFREPAAPPGFRGDDRYARVPMFLMWRAVKPP